MLLCVCVCEDFCRTVSSYGMRHFFAVRWLAVSWPTKPPHDEKKQQQPHKTHTQSTDNYESVTLKACSAKVYHRCCCCCYSSPPHFLKYALRQIFRRTIRYLRPPDPQIAEKSKDRERARYFRFVIVKTFLKKSLSHIPCSSLFISLILTLTF